MMRRLLTFVVVFLLALTSTPSASAQDGSTPIPITTRNAAQVQLQHTMGLGVLQDVVWGADSNTYFAATYGGLWQFDAASPTTPPIAVDANSQYVRQAILSADNQWVALTMLGEFHVRLVNRKTGDGWNAFTEPKAEWNKIMFSAAGYLLAHSSRQRLWLYDLKQRRVVFTLNEVFDFGLAPDGQSFVVMAGRRLQVWDVATQREVARYKPLVPQLRELRFSADGKTLYGLRTNSHLYAFDTDTRDLKFKLLLPNSTMIRFDANNTMALSWRGRKLQLTAQIIDLKAGKLMTPITAADAFPENEPVIRSGALSPDGTRAATLAYDGRLRVWDSKSGKQLRERTVLASPILRFDPTGTRLALRQGNSLMLYDYTTDTMTEQPGLFVNSSANVRFSPDGTLLATIATNGWVNVWQTKDWVLRVSQATSSQFNIGYSLSFSPDSRTLVFGDNQGAWLLDMTAAGNTAPVNLWNKQCIEVDYNATGTHVACIGSENAVILDAVTKRVVWEYQRTSGTRTSFASMAFTPDGKALYILHSRRGVWRLELTPTLSSETPITTPTYPGVRNGQLFFSPDGQLLANYGYDSILRLWDTETGQERFRWSGFTRLQDGNLGRGNRAAFSPDGKIIAVIIDNREVRLYDAASGELLKSITVTAPPYVFSKLAFSPDGSQIVVTTGSGVLLFFGVQP